MADTAPVTTPAITSGGDPKGWTSKPAALHMQETWGKFSQSWLMLLQVTFGVEQPQPLLINERDAVTYVLSGKLAKRDSQNRIVLGIDGVDGFFLFNNTTCEVRQVTAPVGKDKIWESLMNGAKDMTVIDISPVTPLE